jgi:hypothetical protein
LTGKDIPDEEDDGEIEKRLEVEETLVTELESVFSKQQKAILPKKVQTGFFENNIAKLYTTSNKLQSVLFGGLLAATSLGWNKAETQVEAMGLPVDVITADDAIKDWTRTHAFKLVTDINNTTRNALRKKLSVWVESGEPLSALVKDLEPIFGKKRAELIASTEVTQAYARGNVEAWKASEMADQEPEQMPPAHPRCRCWITLTKKSKGVWVYRWNTANDERVCPICGPLHRQSVGAAKA